MLHNFLEERGVPLPDDVPVPLDVNPDNDVNPPLRRADDENGETIRAAVVRDHFWN